MDMELSEKIITARDVSKKNYLVQIYVLFQSDLSPITLSMHNRFITEIYKFLINKYLTTEIDIL